MGGFEFDLKFLTDPAVQGYAGEIGPFGDVIVKSVLQRGAYTHNEAVLCGESFPETAFSGGGAGGVPSLNGGFMRMGEDVVDIALRVKGVRRGARWLDIKYQEMTWIYRSTGQASKCSLEREGVTVTIDRAVRQGDVVRKGKTEGPATPTDLAIALILEQVDTSCLTLTGALVAIPLGFLFRNSRDEGAVC